MAATGADTRLTYLWEDAGYNSTPDDTTHKTFGREPTLDTFEGSNNALRQFEPNSREAAEIIEQEFTGSFTVSFTLSNPWWIRSVITAPSTSGTDPVTHTFDGEMMTSMQIIAAEENTDEERTLTGAVVTSATIDATVPDVVTVSLDGAYADESVASVSTSQVAPSFRSMQFKEASVALGGTTQGYLQDASLSIANNVDIIRELGSRFGVDYSPKARTPDLTYTEILNDSNDSKVERMYGGSAVTEPQDTVENQDSVVFEFTNGETAGEERTITFTLTGAFPNSFSVDGIGDPESDVTGELEEMVESISAEAVNATDPAP